MTPVAVDHPSRERPAADVFLSAGILLAALTEAVAGTALSLGRNAISGDTHATPDEFAWLDVGYTTFKMIGFIITPWLLTQMKPRRLMIIATLMMSAACGLAAMTTHLDLLVVLRIVQGLSGGILLVGGQAILFLAYSRPLQPSLQAMFAMAAVVAPATIAPAFQGWLLDVHSWEWIFLWVVPFGLMAIALLAGAETPIFPKPKSRPFDWMGFSLISVALFCASYVLSQGSRWDWLEEPFIFWLSAVGAMALLAFLGQQSTIGGRGLIDFSAFRSDDFAFAFIVSFVAGAALFGSAYLIPAFAVSVLAFTPTEAGWLLLPSGGLFVGALIFVAYVVQCHRIPPFASVPFGILMIMIAMWMLSGSTSQSGADDMMPAVLLRGLGLGFLFLSITLIAFSNLSSANLASGIGLFNTGRQLGGLMGVGGLQTLIDHGVPGNTIVLSAQVTPGTPALDERLTSVAAMLTAEGMENIAASRAAVSLFARAVSGQSTVIAFDTAFNAVALLFIVAAPLLVIIKIGLHRYAISKAARRRTGATKHPESSVQEAA
ncbi:MFS transporter [Rhizobium sp. 21-4511-3d]